MLYLLAFIELFFVASNLPNGSQEALYMTHIILTTFTFDMNAASLQIIEQRVWSGVARGH
jgi:hypothetical protein